MSAFSEVFDEASAALLEQLGESVIYRPRDGQPRAITAIVTRTDLAGIPGTRTVGPQLMITVRNNSTYGIAGDEYDNGDQVDVAVRRGQPLQKRLIASLAGQHAGMLDYEVR